jgi:hypothetical protein
MSSPPDSPPNVGLAPDTGDTQQSLVDILNNYGTITSYAYALVNASVTELSGQSSWYPTFMQNLGTAQQHAFEWLDVIGPDMFTTIPNAIIDYGTTFGIATDAILKITKHPKGPEASPPEVGLTLSAEQISDIQQAIAMLQQTLQTLMGQPGDSNMGSPPPPQPTIQGVSTDLGTFLDQITADGVNLTNAQTGAQAAVNLDESTINTINTDIATLTSSISSLTTMATVADVLAGISGTAVAVACVIMAPQTGGLSLVVACVGFLFAAGSIMAAAVYGQQVEADQQQLAQDQAQLTDDQAQVSSLQLIVSSLNSLVPANGAAQTSVEAIITTWASLQDYVDDVAQYLSEANPEDVLPFTEMLDIEAAQGAWATLVQFAQAIVQASITPISVTQPTSPP